MTKTQSHYWLYGLPRGSEVDVYAMYAHKLKDFAYQYTKDHPESMKRVGEFKQYCIFIPKPVFVSQPFISKFKTINLN